MKISVITRHAITNYGSLLQALATQITIEKLGYECEIVKKMKKMIKESASSPYVKQLCEDNSVPDNISNIVLGQHEQFFTTQVIINNEEENKLGTAHIIYNKSSKGMLILADFEVSAEDRKKMKDKGVLFANTNELIKSDKFQLLDDYIDNQVADTTIKQDLASALILRIEPSFVDVTVGDDLVDFFKYVSKAWLRCAVVTTKC